MARRAATLATPALLLALLYQASSSAARVLHQDDPVVRVPDVVGSGLTAYGYINVENSCDLSKEGAWDTSDCSLEDDGSGDAVKFALAEGTSLTMFDYVVNINNLPDDMTELGFESADIDVEFDDPDEADKKLYVAVLAGKSPSAMVDCVMAAQAGDSCTVPSDDIYFAWGLTDEEPLSLLGETITLGEGESVYSQTFSATDASSTTLATSEQLDAVRASEEGSLYVGIYMMTNKAVIVKQLGLNGLATTTVTTTPV